MKLSSILLTFLVLCCSVLNAQQKPNILFVYIDDMGFGDLSCYGNEKVSTPNIDQLAREGIRFTQFYVNSPICSPSRVAVTTGQFPARWGITSYISGSQANRKRGIRDYLDLKAPSLARYLHAAGYYTAHIGKWHMGGGRDVGDVPYITEYGFNESVTQFEGIGERYLATYETLDLPDSTRLLEKQSAELGRGEVHWIKRYNATQIYIDRVMKAMERAENNNKPFYINLWPDDIHTPHEPPPALRGEGTTFDHYAGVIVELDKQLGRLFDYIRSNEKLRNNTLIVLSSDNGPPPHIGSSGGLKGFKGNLFEGGIREPLITWGPQLLVENKIGSVNQNAVLAAVDLSPSLLHIAGAENIDYEVFDGVDRSNVLLGKEYEARQAPLMWVRPPDRPKFKGEDSPDLAIREGNYKLLVNTDGSEAHLYDLIKDVQESRDLATEMPDQTEKMKQKVLSWYRSLVQPGNL